MFASIDSYLRAFEPFLQDLEYGYVLTVNGLLCMANDRMLEWTGYTLEAARGRSVLAFAAPECHELLRQHVFSGGCSPVQITGLTQDGTRIEFEALGSPVVDGTENIVRIVRFKRI